MSADDRDQGDRLFTEPPPENIPLAYAVETEGALAVPFFRKAGWLILVYGVWQTCGVLFGMLSLAQASSAVTASVSMMQLTLISLALVYGAILVVAGIMVLRRHRRTTEWLIAAAICVVAVILVLTRRTFQFEWDDVATAGSAPWYLRTPGFVCRIVFYTWNSLVEAAMWLLLARSRLLRGYIGAD